VDDGSVEEIRASHILEHFPAADTLPILREWVRALKPGGWLKIAVPDFKWIAEAYLKGERVPFHAYAMGGQTDEHDFHKALFDRPALWKLLIEAGLEHVRTWESEIKDCASLPVSLNLMAQKPVKKSYINPLSLGKSGETSVAPQRLYGEPQTPDDRFSAFLASVNPKNAYSQFGEDGLIEAIFNRIGVANKWCVECGAGDGLFFSNTRRLIEQGWNSIQIEGDDKQYEQLARRYIPVDTWKQPDGYKHAGVVYAVHECATNFEKIFERFEFLPRDFDLLVVDVDGQDYHLVNSLVRYHPRVLIVEYDPAAERMYIPEQGAPFLDQAGAQAMHFVVQARGYDVVCHTKVNLVCVRQDLSHLLMEATREAPVKEVKPLEAAKPAAAQPNKVFVAGQWREIGYGNGQVMEDKIEVAPIGVATSTPRYGSLVACDVMWQAALALRALPARSGGAWWEQGLSRQIEKLLEQGTERGPVEFILTVDFDSYMTPEDGIKLITLMYENPQLDCIIPTQIRRGMFEDILAGTAGAVNPNDPLIPIIHGHFGFTVFRRRVFERLSKPWMLNVPDLQGGWNDGRVDADIYFWNKFCSEGFKAAMSTEVVIGHGDEGVCWPRMNPDGTVTKVWQSVFEWIQTHKPPAGIIK
jgi:hypothetical protein